MDPWNTKDVKQNVFLAYKDLIFAIKGTVANGKLIKNLVTRHYPAQKAYTGALTMKNTRKYLNTMLKEGWLDQDSMARRDLNVSNGVLLSLCTSKPSQKYIVHQGLHALRFLCFSVSRRLKL